MKALFTNAQHEGQSLTECDLESAAKAVLLPTEEVGFWIDHLNTVAENRRRGAAKAAETRRRKQQALSRTSEPEVFCGTCETKYEPEMPNIEFWICCDMCNKWYCCLCELLSSPPTTEEYKCLKCQSV